MTLEQLGEAFRDGDGGVFQPGVLLDHFVEGDVEGGQVGAVLPSDLLRPDHLAVVILGGGVIVWGSRLFIQVCVFDPAWWRGRALTVLGHLAFVALWSYQTFVLGWALTRQL